MGATITIDNAVKRYGNDTIIDGLSLEIKPGEFFTLLGPSGCGKTTLLRMIIGFNSIEGGTFKINDRVINDVPTNKRNIGMVFQNYAVFPHMSVFDNVAFGLRNRKLPKAEIEEKVNNILKVVKIDHLKDRMPANLSGGQQQRVALARAIVIEPEVLLMDEPLSNLDAKLRGATRREILLLHKRLGATMLYVTHDQTEALTLADRIVCMSMGHVQQVGTPLELYDSPANLFVASFIGLPPMNFFEVTVAGDKLQGKDFQVPLTAEEQKKLAGYQGKEITLGVRPENISEGGSLPVKVFSNENLGMNTLVHGHLGTARITAKLRGWKNYKEGDTVQVSFDRKHFFDKETTNAIGREQKA